MLVSSRNPTFRIFFCYLFDLWSLNFENFENFYPFFKIHSSRLPNSLPKWKCNSLRKIPIVDPRHHNYSPVYFLSKIFKQRKRHGLCKNSSESHAQKNSRGRMCAEKSSPNETAIRIRVRPKKKKVFPFSRQKSILFLMRVVTWHIRSNHLSFFFRVYRRRISLIHDVIRDTLVFITNSTPRISSTVSAVLTKNLRCEQ